MMIFALAIVAFAYTNATQTTPTAAVSCPMMEKHHAATAETSAEKHSCGMENCCKDGKCAMGGACCKDGDSCPMKSGENKETSAVDYSKITFSDAAAKADCCATGASCCKSGAACCKGKHS